MVIKKFLDLGWKMRYVQFRICRIIQVWSNELVQFCFNSYFINEIRVHFDTQWLPRIDKNTLKQLQIVESNG